MFQSALPVGGFSSQPGQSGQGQSGYSIWGLPQPLAQSSQTQLPPAQQLQGGDPVVGRPADHTAWVQAPASVSSGAPSRALPPPGTLPGMGSASVADAPAAPEGATTEAAASSEGNSTGHYVVRCKGLPFSANADTVTGFFNPLEPVEEGVQMRINEDGLPTGECFVGFANEEALKSALERNRKVMGHRFVQVERIFPGELEKACANMRLTDKMRTALGLARPVPTPVAPAAPMGLPPAPGPAATAAQAVASSVGPRSAPPAAGGQNARGRGVGVGDGGSSSGNVVIKMRGLPYSATEPEIAQFFSGLRIAPGGASIGRDANGRASGEAHVEFCSEADAQAAMLLHRQRIGNRYIELFRTKQLPSASRRAVSAEAGGAASDTLRLRGMPFHSTDADVNAFFKGYSIAQGGIKLGPQGGHGSVRFTTAEEARRALVNLNHSYMGNRYIELFVA